jgi:chromosome segregation ATPase
MRPFANRRSMRAVCAALTAASALVLQFASASALSPDDEIARLNRVRQNLFEELVKTRAEAAAARAELEAMTRAREQAEAELTRLRQEAASAKPDELPSTAAISASPPAGESKQKGRQRSSASNPGTSDGALVQSRKVTSSVRRAARPPSANRPVNALPSRPNAQAQGLPSVLRLQDPQ